jgi:hypothetical protein
LKSSELHHPSVYQTLLSTYGRLTKWGREEAEITYKKGYLKELEVMRILRTS